MDRRSYSASQYSGGSKKSKSKSSGPAGGASAGGNYGGTVNPQQKYAGRTQSQRPSNYGGTGPSTTVSTPKKTTLKKGITATKAAANVFKEGNWIHALARLYGGDPSKAIQMAGGQWAWDKSAPIREGLGNAIKNFFFPSAASAEMSKEEHDQLLKDAGVTVEGGSQMETFPRFLAEEYESYKPYMGGPGATQSIVDEYKGSYPGLLDVPTEELQKRFDIGLENPDLMQVSKPNQLPIMAANGGLINFFKNGGFLG